MDAHQVPKSQAYKTARREFYHWAVKWIYKDFEESEAPQPIPADVSEIVGLMRSMGFSLRYYDRCSPEASEMPPAVEPGASGCRVQVKCMRSGLRAVLESRAGDCRCPSTDSAENAEFWQVSGSGLSSSQQEAGSSLLPHVKSGLAEVVRDVLSQLIQQMENSARCSLSMTDLTSIPQRDLPHLKRYRSLDGLSSPVKKPDRRLLKVNQASTNVDEASSMEVENVMTPATDLISCDLSPVPGSSDPEPPRFLRQSTWNKESGSPTSPASLCGSIDNMSLQDKTVVISKLSDAVNNIGDVITMLNKNRIKTAQSRVLPLPRGQKNMTRSDYGSAASVSSMKQSKRKVGPAPALARRASTITRQQSTSSSSTASVCSVPGTGRFGGAPSGRRVPTTPQRPGQSAIPSLSTAIPKFKRPATPGKVATRPATTQPAGRGRSSGGVCQTPSGTFQLKADTPRPTPISTASRIIMNVKRRVTESKPSK